MSLLYNYMDETIYFHHSIDEQPAAINFTMHAHEKHEIFYFSSGVGTYNVEGNEYPLKPGSIMIMRASETHKLHISPDMPYERICINFSPEVIQKLDPELRLLEAFYNRPLGHNNLYDSKSIRSDYIYECLKEMICPLQEMYYQKIIIQTNLYLILSEINKSFLSSTEMNSSDIKSAPMREIIKYINQNINKELSLDLLSTHFFISKSQLNRKFKQVTGSTVWDYIIIKRLLTARQLIRSGQSATRVCEECGFQDYSAFFRAYKKRFTVSPQDDRNITSS